MSESDIKNMDHPKKYERKKCAWLNDFSNIIYKMATDGHNAPTIYSYILKNGYPGTNSSLSDLIRRILYNNFGVMLPRQWNVKYQYADSVTIITRNDIIKYITEKKDSDTKSKVRKYIHLIKEKYPAVKELDEIYTLFHYVLMNNKEDELDLFIEQYVNSSVSTFVNGLKKDIHPAKNAISFRESSGFVEGNNNKFKLIKRILYGRSKLSNLFCKCYPAFLIGKENFELKKALLNSKAYTHY